MSELTLTVMRLGFLAVLWLFVIVAVQVIRSDLYGSKTTQRPTTAGRRGAPVPTPTPRQQPPQQQGRRPQPAPDSGRQRRSAPSQLVVVQGSLAGTTVALHGQTITLGRAHDSTIVLDDDYASSRHARIYPDQSGQWIVEDLNSTNGTYLDRMRLTSPTPLQPGVAIRIGRTVIELRK
jgi:pSer/pThr/pTyr-binding forkhead associated (FHA) protein